MFSYHIRLSLSHVYGCIRCSCVPTFSYMTFCHDRCLTDIDEVTKKHVTFMQHFNSLAIEERVESVCSS